MDEKNKKLEELLKRKKWLNNQIIQNNSNLYIKEKIIMPIYIVFFFIVNVVIGVGVGTIFKDSSFMGILILIFILMNVYVYVKFSETLSLEEKERQEYLEKELEQNIKKIDEVKKKS